MRVCARIVWNAAVAICRTDFGALWMPPCTIKQTCF